MSHENAGPDRSDMNRREFLGRSAAIAGAALIAPQAGNAAEGGKRTATDKVPLGKKGLKICRLGIGTGSSGGDVQRKLGRHVQQRRGLFVGAQLLGLGPDSL